MLRSIILCAMILLVAGCMAPRHYQYESPSSTSGKRCVARCLKGKSYCEQLCLWKNQGCWTRQRQRAQADFDYYKQLQLSAGHKVRKRLRDFEDTSVCRQACNCLPAYNTCYRACGGSVKAS